MGQGHRCGGHCDGSGRRRLGHLFAHSTSSGGQTSGSSEGGWLRRILKRRRETFAANPSVASGERDTKDGCDDSAQKEDSQKGCRARRAGSAGNTSFKVALSP